MSYERALLAIVVIAACGCSQRGLQSGSGAPTEPTMPPLSIMGSKGEVALGDTLEQAKRAFPAPVGAQITESSTCFAGHEGWLWHTRSGSEGFGVMMRNGRVAVVFHTLTGDLGPAIKAAERAWGKQTHRVVGKSAVAESWVSGDYACIAVSFSGVDKMGLLVVGAKADLRGLAYDADDMGPLVKLLDNLSEMGEKLAPLFPDAKGKAPDKAPHKHIER